MPKKYRLAGVVGLRNDVEIVDLEERMKDRMRRGHRHEARAWQHAPHVLLERSPTGAAEISLGLEVVDDDEAALLHVGAEVRGLRVGHLPPADLDDVGDRILEQLRIVEGHGVDGFLSAEIRNLVHNFDQVLFGDRIAVRPGRQTAPPVAAGVALVDDAHEVEAPVVGGVGIRLEVADSAAVVSAETPLRERAHCDQQDDRDGGKRATSTHQ